MAAYPMSQADLYLILPLGWGAYTEHQVVFGKYKKTKYTATLEAEALARLEAAMKMPSQQARGAVPESTRLELVQQRDEFLDQWNLLDGYLEEAYRETGDHKAKREAAGSKLYEAAAEGDWGAAQEMVNQALAFVTANAATLKEKGDMDDDFVATITAEGEDVRRVVRRYLKEQEAAQKGTTTKVGGERGVFRGVSADVRRWAAAISAATGYRQEVSGAGAAGKGARHKAGGDSRGGDRRQWAGRGRRDPNGEGKA